MIWKNSDSYRDAIYQLRGHNASRKIPKLEEICSAFVAGRIDSGEFNILFFAWRERRKKKKAKKAKAKKTDTPKTDSKKSENTFQRMLDL